MDKNFCQVCSSKSLETKIMLTKLNMEYIPDFREEEQNRAEGFMRLFSSVFGDSTTRSTTFNKCPHDRYNRYMRRKLKCDNTTFNELCSSLVDKLAERSYHLDTLFAQTRTISKTALILSREGAQIQVKLQENMEEQKPTRPSINSQNVLPTQMHPTVQQPSYPMMFFGGPMSYNLIYPPQEMNASGNPNPN